jgi:hypothetical protein
VRGIRTRTERGDGSAVSLPQNYRRETALPWTPLPTHHNIKNTALPIGKTVFFTIRFYMRIKGLEPSLLSEPEPKSGASANFAISARFGLNHHSTPLFYLSIKIEKPGFTKKPGLLLSYDHSNFPNF